jgi:hypothetical protein
MPDWQQVVRNRLSRLNLDAAEREDICTELASHLEDDYHSALAAGATEELAIRRALRHVHDWHDLKCKIESSRKKELPMNKRVSQFWFPAFLTLLLAMVFLMIIQEIGPKPWISPAWGGPPRMAPVAVVYFSWLLTLPFIGALGAYLGTRAGARPAAVFSSVAFPVFPYLAFFIIGLPIAAILDDHVAHNIMLPAFFVGFGAWVLLPAIALLAGGVPVHFFSARKVSR